MRTVSSLAGAALLLAGCAAAPNPAAAPMRAPGAPRPPPVAALPAPAPEPPAVTLPERIEIPASYRLVQLAGHLVLVREADPRALTAAPTALRVVAGELARGELAYQPALLPQELAAAVAAERERAARLDRALADVMERSRALSEQALQLKAQSQQVAELLAAAEARLHAPAPAVPPPPSE